MDYFTADPHFGHFNIIKHCHRGFATVEAMDACILDKWNARLKRGDRLFILGDFLGQRDKADVMDAYLKRINLHRDAIWLILGNHDYANECRRVFTHVREVYDYRHPETKQHIWLSHYAHKTWKQSHRNEWHLYGHSHGTLQDDPFSLSFDCGVDCYDFELLSFDNVSDHMSLKRFLPVDKHR